MNIYQNQTPRVILEYRDRDPFTNMILKSNKSPILKPVCVKPKILLRKNNSEVKILKYSALPPIPQASRYKIILETPSTSRYLLKTPTFCSNRTRRLINFSEMKFT